MNQNQPTYSGKKALLIGGGGTIGTYVAKELLNKGASVDIICLEDYCSDNERLTYFKEEVTTEFLRTFLSERYYDAIVNFIHYTVPEDYIEHHMIIAPKTDQEVFLSSIRAVGDALHPISEKSPLILDLIDEGQFADDPVFIAKDDYALSKARCERYLKYVSKQKNWTIVRPMISSSDKRLDLIQYTFHEVVDYAKEGKIMYLPDLCKEKVAGIEWAGNTGKLLANLLFRSECLGETYLLSTGHHLTWENVAEVYTRLLGLRVEWVPTDVYRAKTGKGGSPLFYDRGYDRFSDNSKVLAATGLENSDFTPFEEGIKRELISLGAI